MAKTRRNFERQWDDEEGYREKKSNNKRHEKRLERALKTRDFSMLDEDDDFEGYSG